MPNELRKPTIDEAIECSEKQFRQCEKDGFKNLCSYWQGYHDALSDVKRGGFILEQESKR